MSHVVTVTYARTSSLTHQYKHIGGLRRAVNYNCDIRARNSFSEGARVGRVCSVGFEHDISPISRSLFLSLSKRTSRFHEWPWLQTPGQHVIAISLCNNKHTASNLQQIKSIYIICIWDITLSPGLTAEHVFFQCCIPFPYNTPAIQIEELILLMMDILQQPCLSLFIDYNLGLLIFFHALKQEMISKIKTCVVLIKNVALNARTNSHRCCFSFPSTTLCACVHHLPEHARHARKKSHEKCASSGL